MLLTNQIPSQKSAMYREFRGRDPIVEPLLIERGLAARPPG